MHDRDEGCYGPGSWELLSHREVEGTGLGKAGLCSSAWVAMEKASVLKETRGHG